KTVLVSLNQYYQQGIIYCTSLGSIADLINMDLAKGILPKSVNGKDIYPIGAMRVQFRKYTDSARVQTNSQNDFSLYYPVQSVLKSGKEEQLISKIKNDNAEKVIILTTNDHTINVKNVGLTDLRILDAVDETFNLDNSESNPELYEMVRNNIEKRLF